MSLWTVRDTTTVRWPIIVKYSELWGQYFSVKYTSDQPGCYICGPLRYHRWLVASSSHHHVYKFDGGSYYTFGHCWILCAFTTNISKEAKNSGNWKHIGEQKTMIQVSTKHKDLHRPNVSQGCCNCKISFLPAWNPSLLLLPTFPLWLTRVAQTSIPMSFS